MSQSVLLTLIQICFTSIICFTTVNLEWTDRPRVLPRLHPDFVCLEVSFGNFSMKSFLLPADLDQHALRLVRDLVETLDAIRSHLHLFRIE